MIYQTEYVRAGEAKRLLLPLFPSQEYSLNTLSGQMPHPAVTRRGNLICHGLEIKPGR